jgi:hypothetical protein
MDFSDLFSNGKSGGLDPRCVDRAARLESIVDRSGADMRAWWHLAVARRAGSRARRCSLAMVEEDEMDEAVLEGCSLEHERRQRAVATEVKNGGGLSSARGRRRGSSGERGKGVVRAKGARRIL